MSEESPVIVPYRQLSPEALQGVIEEYVTRDGTELTDAEHKVSSVRASLESGELVLAYDPESESCNILRPEDVEAAEIERARRVELDGQRTEQWYDPP